MNVPGGRAAIAEEELTLTSADGALGVVLGLGGESEGKREGESRRKRGEKSKIEIKGEKERGRNLGIDAIVSTAGTSTARGVGTVDLGLVKVAILQESQREPDWRLRWKGWKGWRL